LDKTAQYIFWTETKVLQFLNEMRVSIMTEFKFLGELTLLVSYRPWKISDYWCPQKTADLWSRAASTNIIII